MSKMNSFNETSYASNLADFSGRTANVFGIFPIGFIVTAIWAVLFLFVQSLGIMARLRTRRRPEIIGN